MVFLLVLLLFAKIHTDVLAMEPSGRQVHHHAQVVIGGWHTVVWKVLRHLCDLVFLVLISLTDSCNSVLSHSHL